MTDVTSTPPAPHAPAQRDAPPVRGRVIVIRSRLAVVRLTTEAGHEFDIDLPLAFLPEGVDRGDRLAFEISKAAK